MISVAGRCKQGRGVVPEISFTPLAITVGRKYGANTGGKGVRIDQRYPWWHASHGLRSPDKPQSSYLVDPSATFEPFPARNPLQLEKNPFVFQQGSTSLGRTRFAVGNLKAKTSFKGMISLGGWLFSEQTHPIVCIDQVSSNGTQSRYVSTSRIQRCYSRTKRTGVQSQSSRFHFLVLVSDEAALNTGKP